MPSLFNKVSHPWPETWKGQHRLNLILAWCWFLFAVYGLSEYIGLIPHNPFLGDKIAQSIPVLFFISVYANFVGHLSTAEAAKPESESMTEDEQKHTA